MMNNENTEFNPLYGKNEEEIRKVIDMINSGEAKVVNKNEESEEREWKERYWFAHPPLNECFVGAKVWHNTNCLEYSKENENFYLYHRPGFRNLTFVKSDYISIKDVYDPYNNVGFTSKDGKTIMANRYFIDVKKLLKYNVIVLSTDFSIDDLKQDNPEMQRVLLDIASWSSLYIIGDNRRIDIMLKVDNKLKEVFNVKSIPVDKERGWNLIVRHMNDDMRLLYGLNDMTLDRGEDNFYRIKEINCFFVSYDQIKESLDKLTSYGDSKGDEKMKIEKYGDLIYM